MVNVSKLWQYQNYNAPVNYVFDKRIVEYDISKANISILYDKGKLSKDDYINLYNSDRMVRQYTIGCMIRDDHSIQDVLNDGLAEARFNLFSYFGLEDHNVLHVVKDAVFMIIPMTANCPLSIKVSESVSFTRRSEFNNYLRLNRFIHFYHKFAFYDSCNTHKIRGMNEDAQRLHNGYFTHILDDILEIKQKVDTKHAYERCRDWYTKLANHEISVENARRFDSQSRYDLIVDSAFSTFQADYLSDGAEVLVSPAYNLKLLSDIGNCLLCEIIQSR